GFFEIIKLHAAFADSDAFFQCRAARFVAHVRAIRQIVRPELPREKLIQERGFVACPAARVKYGRVRRRQCVQLATKQREYFVPLDWLIVRRAFAFHHWMNKSALKLEPVVRLLAQVRDRVFAKEFRTDMFSSRLARQGFDAVLAKLEQMSIFVRT